jgi:hypothetical protein
MEQNGWTQLGRSLAVKYRARPEPSLFDPPRYDDPRDDEPVLLKLRDIRLERSRGFGDAWLALRLWRWSFGNQSLQHSVDADGTPRLDVVRIPCERKQGPDGGAMGRRCPGFFVFRGMQTDPPGNGGCWPAKLFAPTLGRTSIQKLL